MTQQQKLLKYGIEEWRIKMRTITNTHTGKSELKGGADGV